MQRIPSPHSAFHRLNPVHPTLCLAGLLYLVSLVATPARAADAADAADAAAESSGSLLLHGGTIHTFEGDEARTVESLLAIRGEVVHAGSLERARQLASEYSRRTGHAGAELVIEDIDLQGATAVPGLVDAHAHLMNLGKIATRVTLFGARSEEECVSRAEEFEKTLPPEVWLLGRGWDQNDWEIQHFPSRELLDASFGDRPVILVRVDGHASWANSAALRAAGIDSDTPDPEGGEILRDAETGEPTGILIDAAEELLWSVVPEPDATELDRRLRAGMKSAIEHGLTGIHEMGAGVEAIAAMRRTQANGELALRLVIYLGGDKVLQEWEETPMRPGPEALLRIEGVKFYMDGALGSRGAALLEDYSDRPGHRGLFIESQEKMSRHVCDSFRRGYSVAIHAIGDAANRAALDAIVAGHQLARASNPELAELAQLRPRVEHCQVLHADDIPRFAQLGVVASMQPTHCTSDMPWAPQRLGASQLEGAYAWRSLRESGCELPLGSDFPVEAVSPLLGLYAARTRRGADGQPEEGWTPDQCLDATEALLGFTAWTGRAIGVPQWGTLRPGSRADITVLEHDPLRDPVEILLSTKVLRTVVEGRSVYRAE